MTNGIVLRLIVRSCIVGLIMACLVFFLFIPRLLRMLPAGKSITILTWPMVLDAQYLDDFERQTGIRVYLRYFESNEELFVKLKTTQGYGYDLIMPSDYMTDLLIKEGLVKKIDTSRLTFLDTINPILLHHYYDPNNAYSIPFFWGVYGLGIDTDYFHGKMPPASWSLIFDQQIAPERIGVIDDARELILITAQYLFGTIDNLTDEQIEQIKQTLIKQKKWVYMYTDERSGYLLASKTCPVVVTTSGDIARVMRYHDNIGFIIPKEGSFMVIDTFAMPIGSTKDDFAYQFLNYLYQPHVLKKYVDKFGFFPPTTNVVPAIAPERLAMPTQDMLESLDFFRNVLSENTLNNLWISLKA